MAPSLEYVAWIPFWNRVGQALYSRSFKSSSKASCLLLSTLAQQFLFLNLQSKPSQMGWCPLTRKAHAWWIRHCLGADLSPPGRSENWTELLMPLACGVINPWINKRGRWDFGLFSSQSSLPAGSWKKTTAAFPFCMESNGFLWALGPPRGLTSWRGPGPCMGIWLPQAAQLWWARYPVLVNDTYGTPR